MKRFLPFAPMLLLSFLLLSPAAAFSGARQGLELWWSQVFPALLPSFICVRLAQGLGFLRIGDSHPRGQLAAAVCFSLVSGAPNGAKLLNAITEDGTISSREGERLLPWINSVSPAFLLSIIASELLKNKGLFLPLAVAYYGCILSFIVIHMLQHAPVPAFTKAIDDRRVSFSHALSGAIESSMLDMLRIGGCILFICSLLSLLAPLVPGKGAYAALAGCLEVNVGASAIAKLSMPLRIKASLLAGVSAFGGLSLTLQTACCYPALRLFPYIARKLLLGLAVGLVCYLLFPLFPHVSAAFADRQQVIERSLSVSALLLSSVSSIVFIGLVSLMVRQRTAD